MKNEPAPLRFAFRKAAARDLSAIAQIYDSSFSQWVDTRHTYGYFAAALADTNNNELITATDDKGNVAGFILLNAQNTFMPQGLNVDVVAVDDRYRGQGLGRALMEKAEENALSHQFKYVSLQVHEENAGAIALYKKMDYVTIGRLEHYYTDGKGAENMYKRVTPKTPPRSLEDFLARMSPPGGR